MSLALISCFSVKRRLSSKYFVSISYVSCSHCCKSPNGICWRSSSWRSASHRARRTYTHTGHFILAHESHMYFYSSGCTCTHTHSSDHPFCNVLCRHFYTLLTRVVGVHCAVCTCTVTPTNSRIPEFSGKKYFISSTWSVVQRWTTMQVMSEQWILL